VLDNSEVLIDHFDYEIFDNKIHADLLMIKSQQNDADTLFLCSNIVIGVNLLDIFFSNTLNIDHLYIDSMKVDIIKSDNDDLNNINYILSKLSSFNQDIILSHFNINELIIDHNNYSVDNISLSTNLFRIKKDYLNIENIKLSKDNSLINAHCHISNNLIEIDIQDSYLQNIDSSLYTTNIPLFSNNDKINFSSLISMSVDSITGTSLVKFGYSILDLDFVANTNTNTISVNYDSNIKLEDFEFIPPYYYDINNINMVGNVELFPNDSLNYQGLIDSDYGEFEFEVNGFQDALLDFKFYLNDVDIGFLLDKPELRHINGKFSLHSKNNQFSNFNANIGSLFYNGYDYKNISIKDNTGLDNDMSYDIIVKDSNLNLFAQCNIDYHKGVDYVSYQSNLSGTIQELDLNDLNYNISDSISSLSTDFSIVNIDVVKYIDQVPFLKLTNPSIKLTNLIYNKNESSKSIDFINLQFDHNMEYVSMNSDIGIGECQIFDNNILDFFSRKKDVEFQLSLDLNKASVFSDILFNHIDLNDEIICDIKVSNNNFPSLHLMTPSIKIFNTQLLDIDLNTEHDNSSLMEFKINKLVFLDNISIDDFVFSSELEHSSENTFTISYLSENIHQSFLNGKILYSSNQIDFDFETMSFMHFSDQQWSLDPDSKIIFNNDKLTFQNFSLNSNTQNINISGWLNKDPYIAFSFSNFQLNPLNRFLKKDNLFFDGIVDGDVFFNTSSFPVISGNFEVNDFSFNNILLGKLQLSNNSNEKNDSLYTSGSINNINNIMNFLVKYPLDGTKNIHANINFNQFPADVLDVFINPISDLNGNLNGDIIVKGPIDDYHIFGRTDLEKINFKIPYLGTDYSAQNNSLLIDFDQDKIIINEFDFYDNIYNTSAIFNGEITHSALKDMSYNLVVQSDSLYALNTGEYDNANYYGDIFLEGELFIQGAPQKIKLDIDGQSKEGSAIMIPLLGSKEIQENKFIQFINTSSQPLETFNAAVTKPIFNMDFNLSIDNQSEIQLIFDEELGDLMRGYGEGDLLLKINKEGDFEIFGDFEIEKGNYLFTLQDVITKSFEIERGGVINFNGNLENARVDLNVLYNVQASLYPLNPDYDRNQKSPIVCRMAMSGPLLQPEIEFDIDILNGDQIVETSLESITNTDQKLLEQFLYLLIANSFLIENDPNVDYLGNTLATTGTELLSSQLSNWLSQTTDAFDLGFKWIPGTSDSLSYQQVELAVSKKFLDNRVIVNGNVGTPPEQSEANIVGDLDIEYDFFKDGRFKLRVFNRTEDYDPLSESLGYEQGIGIFFKKQFNTFPDLFIIEKNE